MIDKYIKNIDVVTNTYQGQEITSGSYYLIQQHESVNMANDDHLLDHINNGKAQMARSNDGNNDIAGVSNQINFLKGIDPQKDADGAYLSRTKLAKSGHHYQGMFGELRIGHSDIYSKKKDNSTNINFWSVTRYDAQGAVTTNNADAVKTVYNFEAGYDIGVVGIKVWQASPPGSDIRFWVEGAPHIPLASGGEVKFVEGGGNLKLMGSGLVLDLDGRVPKEIAFDNVNYSHRFELTAHHPVSTDHSILTKVEYFKPPGV